MIGIMVREKKLDSEYYTYKYIERRRKQSMIRTCKNCTERHVGCHSTCKAYKLEKQRHEENQARIRQEKASYNLYREYKNERMIRVLYH